MFDRQWFIKHQRLLLWFANSQLGRKILCLNTSSVGKNKIIQILPNAIFWKEGRKLKAEFRTHDKFSKRIYIALLPLWRLFHLWDMALANKVAPSLNLGFDTLTTYPAAGSNSPIDGVVDRTSDNETLANKRSGAGTGAFPTSASDNVYSLQAGTVSGYQHLARGIFLFATSSLTASATITALTLSLFGQSSADGLTGGASANSALVTVASTPAANNALATSDYGQTGTTDFGRSGNLNSLSTAAYNDITLNASGIANVSLTGISKFGIRSGWDFDNTEVGITWVANGWTHFNCYFADQAGTTNDPKLVVTFTLPGGGINRSYGFII